MVQSQIEAIYPLKSINAIAIPGYVNGDEVKKLSMMPELQDLSKIKQKKILFVGRLSIEKNIELLLAAFKSLVDTYGDIYKLIIIGDGPEKNRIKEFNDRYGNVIYLGYLDNPYNIMQECDCLISSSRYEGFGLTAIEAMMCGCPVVSVDNGGITEILENGKYGIVTKQSSESLKDGIVKLFADENLKTQMVKKGYERAQKYDISNAIKEIEMIFELGGL